MTCFFAPSGVRPKPTNARLFGVGDDWTLAAAPWNSGPTSRAVAALRLGVTRFPGGAVSNYWNMTAGNMTSPCTACGACDPARGTFACGVAAKTRAYPPHTFDTAVFLAAVAGHCRTALPVFDLNVLTMNGSATAAEVAALAALIRPTAAAPAMFEFGNEYYLFRDYGCILPNASVYAQAAAAAAAEVERLYPPASGRAQMAAVASLSGLLDEAPSWEAQHWNAQLRQSPLFPKLQAVTLHDYKMKTAALHGTNTTLWDCQVAAFGAANMQTIARAMPAVFGPDIKVWMTEFGILYSVFDSEPYFARLNHGGLKALHVIGRVLAAVEHSDVFDTLQYYSLGGQGWGAQAGMLNWTSNAQAAYEVDAVGQLYAHLNSLATPTSTMQSLVPQGCQAPPSGLQPPPVMPTPVGNETNLPCLQAVVFEAAPGGSTSWALLNRCPDNQTAVLPVAQKTRLPSAAPDLRITMYPAGPTSPAGFAPLPDVTASFPWPGPLQAVVSTARSAPRPSATRQQPLPGPDGKDPGATNTAGAQVDIELLPFSFTIIEQI